MRVEALGFSPKFGALIQTIPGPVLGGLSIVVFGLIAATAGRIWVENRVDFSQGRNLIAVAVGVALVLDAGNFKLSLRGFTLDGIGTTTFGASITLPDRGLPPGRHGAGLSQRRRRRATLDGCRLAPAAARTADVPRGHRVRHPRGRCGVDVLARRSGHADGRSGRHRVRPRYLPS